MDRPVCAYCHNKIDDNTYIWINKEQIIVHKACKIMTDEMRKDVTITVSPAKMGIKGRM